jgi:uncharacterized protein
MKNTASGRFVLRMPPAFHKKLRDEARRRQVSLNTICQQALEGFLTRNHLTLGTDGESASLVAAISELVGVALIGVVLFGSMARGDSREGSDLDLLVVIRQSLPLTRSLYSRWDQRFAPDEGSPHFVHLPLDAMAAGSLWFEAAVDGIVLHDVDDEVARFLGSIRRLIASGKLTRRSAYGHPYWVKSEEEAPRVQ